MKFKVSKASLNRGINIAIKAVPSHSTMAIMSCMLVKAEENSIELTGNDLEIGIMTTIDAEVTEPGIVALDAKMFQSIISKMPSGDISVSVDDNYVTTIKSGKARFSISGQNPEMFTGLPEIETENPFLISGDALREMIQGTLFSVATNETSKVMTGELFQIKDDNLRIVALDGHRLALREVNTLSGHPDMKVVVPAKSMNEISKIINPAFNEDVYIYSSDNHLVLKIEDTIITTRLIDGEYFDVNRVINANCTTQVTVDKNALIECIERAGLFVKAGDKKPIILDIRDNEIEFSINSPTGAMVESLDVYKHGEDLHVGFNPHLLADAIKATPDNIVKLSFAGAKSPCYIKDEDMNYFYMVLPVNI